MTKKNLSRLFTALGFGLFLAAAGFADTLELKDGRVIQGKYLGGTQAVLRFEVNGDVQTFPTNSIVALTFTRGSGGVPVETPPPPPPQDAPPPPQASNEEMPPVTSRDVTATEKLPPATGAYSTPPPGTTAPSAGGDVTLPAGQSLLVRMIDGVDSSKNHVGDIFKASLETDLFVNDVLVARKGTDVYGRLASADEGGKFSGKSELQLELTKLVIDGKDYPLLSSDYNLQGKSRGADSAKKVGGGAVVGAIIGGIAAGGKGAAIGAAAGGGAGAGVQILTKGQQVKVPSETLLEFRLQQPAVVSPVKG